MARNTIVYDLGAVVANLFYCKSVGNSKLRKVLNLKSQLSSTGYVKVRIRFGSPNKLGYITHYPEYLCVCTAHTHIQRFAISAPTTKFAMSKIFKDNNY